MCGRLKRFPLVSLDDWPNDTLIRPIMQADKVNPSEAQRQKWFTMRFPGGDDEIDVDTEEPAFSAWQWVPARELPELIVSFKRQLCRDMLRQFQGIHAANLQAAADASRKADAGSSWPKWRPPKQ